MARHRKIVVEHPEWVDKAPACLRSVAEDAYYARALAQDKGAHLQPKCSTLIAAATKSLRAMENTRTDERIRCKEGDRAARKFWEAKVCAREK